MRSIVLHSMLLKLFHTSSLAEMFDELFNNDNDNDNDNEIILFGHREKTVKC